MLQARYQVFKMTKVENPPGYTERVGYTKRLIRLLLVQPGAPPQGGGAPPQGGGAPPQGGGAPPEGGGGHHQ